MEPVQTPSPDHTEFDRMVSQVDDFEPLPCQTVPVLDGPERPDEPEAEVGHALMAGLVSPV